MNICELPERLSFRPDGFPDAQPTASEHRNCYFISSFLIICFLLHIVIYEGCWWFFLVGVGASTLSVGWREGRVVCKKAGATCPLRFSSTRDGERRLMGGSPAAHGQWLINGGERRGEYTSCWTALYQRGMGHFIAVEHPHLKSVLSCLLPSVCISVSICVILCVKNLSALSCYGIGSLNLWSRGAWEKWNAFKCHWLIVQWIVSICDAEAAQCGNAGNAPKDTWSRRLYCSTLSGCCLYLANSTTAHTSSW